jgi:signal transduction histidine kinase
VRSPITAFAPAAWLRLPRRTARLRLTLLYSGLFLLSGTCVLALVYVLSAGGPTIDVARAFPVPRSVSVDPGARVHEQVVAQHTADSGRLLAVSWLALAVTTVASALLGWFAAGRVLRPLRAITDTARTISAGNLHERLALTGPDDEFKRLGDTLDDLLARLEASFDAQRRFVANASHELRTPLTVERTLLQVALADPDATAATLRSTCEELLASGAEHERLLEALLTLASSERGLEHCEPVDLSVLAGRTLRAPRPEIDELGLAVETELAPAPTTGDPALLERLVANLVDNAVSHNVPHGRLAIRTATGAGHALLTVTNTGAPIPAEETARLFEPFHRLSTTRMANGDHHGLGLSIVRAIASAHHAGLSVRPRPGGGLEVEVRFPGSPERD